METFTQPLRVIGGIINSTDLNYNFQRIAEDLQLAVEGLIFNEKYAQLPEIKDRDSIPLSDLVTGMWVAVAENGIVYEYDKKYNGIMSTGISKKTFGYREKWSEDGKRSEGFIQLGDLPEKPTVTWVDVNKSTKERPLYGAWYECVADSWSRDFKFTSATTGLTYNHGDWALYIKNDGDVEGHWIRVPKWIPIMDVTSILENNLLGTIDELDAKLQELLAELGDKVSVWDGIQLVWEQLGDIDNLTTDTKTSAVEAINELDTRVGELSNLNSTILNRTNIVRAINEIDNEVGFGGQTSNLNPSIEDKSTVVKAVNSIHTRVGLLSALNTDIKARTTVIAALNEVDSELGTIENLTTKTTTNMVAAINTLDRELGRLVSIRPNILGSTIVDSLNNLYDDVGDIKSLTTDTKATVVAAINELDTRAGELGNLTTAHRTNLVAAINDLGNVSNLTTAAKSTAVAAINELDSDVGDKGSLTTSAKNNLVAAINELDKDVGDVSALTTTATDNTVAAINELKAITDTLKGAYIYIGRINLTTASVTQTVLTNRAKEITGKTSLQVGWVLVDDEQHEWYYSDTNVWIDMEQQNIYHATNNTWGTVRGGTDISILDGLMTVLHSVDSDTLGGHAPGYYATDADLGKVNTLTTAAKVAVEAVNELDAEHGILSTLKTEHKTTFVGAINEIHDDLGALSSLTTDTKSTAVAAINELDADVKALQSDIVSKAYKSDVLEKNNTVEFTPTEDYQPATKKYVDTIAHGAEWGNIYNNIEDQEDLMTYLTRYALDDSVITKTNTKAYTPTASYNPATKKYVDDKVSKINTWGQIKGDIKDQQDLQDELLAKQDRETAWNTSNLIVSTVQPAVPDEGYIIWIDLNS